MGTATEGLPEGFLHDEDPDADTAGADFGNTVEADDDDAAAAAAAATPAAQPRAADGTFKKKEGAGDGQEAAAAAAATAGAAQAGGEQVAAAAAGEGEAATGEETEEDRVAREAAEAEATAVAAGGRVEEADEAPVPYARFKQVVDKANGLAAKLQTAETALSASQKEAKDEIKVIDEKLDGLYTEVEVKRAEGDSTEAAKLQRAIDGLKEQKTMLRTEQIATRQAYLAQESTAYNTMLDAMERAEPSMNPDAAEFDPALVQEMEFQVSAYQKAGMSAPQALRRATALIFRRDIFAAPRPAAAKPAAAAAAVADKPVDRKTNVRAANATPPIVEREAQVAVDALGGKKIADLTEEEFDALPEAVQKRERGDFLG